MGQVTSTFTTPEINGSWNNWAGASNQMTDADGDNVWEGTISLLHHMNISSLLITGLYKRLMTQMLPVLMEILYTQIEL